MAQFDKSIWAHWTGLIHRSVSVAREKLLVAPKNIKPKKNLGISSVDPTQKRIKKRLGIDRIDQTRVTES